MVAFACCSVLAGSLGGGQAGLCRDMTGKMGVGLQVTGAGMPVAAIRYWRTHYAIEAMAGWTSHDRQVPTVTVVNGAFRPDSGSGQSPTAEAITACQKFAKDPGVTVTCKARVGLSGLRVAGGVLVRIADDPRASLAIGVRPWLQSATESTTPAITIQKEAGAVPQTSAATAKALPNRFGLEFPLIAEFFLNDHISFTGQVAVELAYGRTPEYATGAVLSNATDRSFWLALDGNWSGGAGVSFYF